MDGAASMLEVALKGSVVLFMVGNLLDMGLKLQLQDALAGLRNVPFVVQSVVWGFVLCPGLAYLLAMSIRLEPAYAMGLILLGLAPSAPFLPPMAERAGGDMGATAAFMLLASCLTVAFMPVALPLLVEGLTASAWTIAKPLLLFVLVPLAIGVAIQRVSAPVAAGLQPFVKRATGLVTIIMLALCLVVFGKGFIGAIGTYAIGAQILFFSIVTAATYGLSVGLSQGQKSVLVLGMVMRNVGAAIAPLFAVADADQRAIVMVVLAVPLQIIFALLVSRWLGRRASVGKPAAARADDAGS
jgi:BASS family bile acid:Na+ symporter